jgi:hypothetical protein
MDDYTHEPAAGTAVGRSTMTSLADFLFPAPAERSAGAIWRWWDRRRLPYNLIVGAAGLITMGVADLAFLILEPDEGPVPWQAAVFFGVAANICYLLGPTVEILAHKIWGRSLLPIGPALYRMGLTFSVGLAFFPAILLTLIAVISVILRLF